MKILFGKYRGREIEDVPSDYLVWLVENMDPEPLPKSKHGKTVEQVERMRELNKDLISAAEDELLNREQT
jgi:uncharacterized protein (DUF3820 family)